MAASIKLFQFAQELFQMLGIRLPKQNEILSFRSRNIFFLFCYTQLSISMAAFFLFEANTMLEYGSSFFMSLTQFCIAMDYLVLMWRFPNILELIADFEDFIEKSKKQFKWVIATVPGVWDKLKFSIFSYEFHFQFNRIAHYKRCTFHVWRIEWRNWKMVKITIFDRSYVDCSGIHATSTKYSYNGLSHGQLERWVVLCTFSSYVSIHITFIRWFE